MKETTQPKYDLENRTYEFAKEIRAFTKLLPNSVENLEDKKQLVKASGSVAANYIEANEALSRKDFLYRIKVCRKESKECRLFLQLIEIEDARELMNLKAKLVNEATELTKIFNSIAEKTENKK